MTASLWQQPIGERMLQTASDRSGGTERCAADRADPRCLTIAACAFTRRGLQRFRLLSDGESSRASPSKNLGSPFASQLRAPLVACRVEEFIQLHPLCCLIFLSLQYHLQLHAGQCTLIRLARRSTPAPVSARAPAPCRSLSPTSPLQSWLLRIPATTPPLLYLQRVHWAQAYTVCCQSQGALVVCRAAMRGV